MLENGDRPKGRALGAAVLAALLATGCATSRSGDAVAATAADEGVELSRVIAAVKKAIVEAETRDVRGFPPLKRVVLKLQTTVARTASGDIRYLVATAGATAGSAEASTLELDLTPSEAPPRRGFSEARLEDALAQAIHVAKIGVAEAAKGDPPMAMSSVVVDLKFTVSSGGSAGVDAGLRILPVGIHATGAISRERHHEVHLVFGSGS